LSSGREGFRFFASVWTPPAAASSRSTAAVLLAMILMFAYLPLLGAAADGLPLNHFRDAFDHTRRLRHAPFSPAVFAVGCGVVLAFLVPFVLRLFSHRPEPKRAASASFWPWWSWPSFAALLGCWIVAWAPLPAVHDLRIYTFVPQWISYCAVTCAITVRRGGRCLALERPWAFLALAPISALYWWFFEYFNRFLENWFYTAPGLPDNWTALHFGTIPFATILPAILCTEECLSTFPRLTEPFRRWRTVDLLGRRRLAAVTLAASAALLFALPVFPNYLFFAPFIVPLTTLVSLQMLLGQRTFFQGIGEGDWRATVSFSAAGLVCGFFWEMWNYYSLAKWQYSVPLVGRYHIFEMPILGYAGYLPFGLCCGSLIDLLIPHQRGVTGFFPARKAEGKPSPVPLPQ
jgi:hypothetical protein